MTGAHTRRVVASALLLIAGAALWFLLAPTALGGATTYVTSFGTSMEPGFHAGDLVLVRESDRYEEGDVVGYQSDLLGSIVLHRIVGRTDDGFVLKGDNNDFLDPENPTSADILGTSWVHVPVAGKLLELRSPWLVAALVGAGLMLLLAGGAVAGRGRRRGRRVVSQPGRTARAGRSPLVGTIFLVSLLVAVVLAAAAALTLLRPELSTTTSDVAYTQTGRFDYTATAEDAAVYAGGRARTGDTLFLQNVSGVTVGFAYRFVSDAGRRLEGSIGLRAELSGESGWRRTVRLVASRRFAGDTAVVSAVLPIDRIQRTAGRISVATGIPQAGYSIAILPEVRVSGRHASAPLSARFAPRLEFAATELSLRPKIQDAGGKTTPDAFEPSEDGTTQVRSTREATLSFAGAEPTLGALRRGALGAAAAAILVALLAGLLLLRGRGAGPAERIAAEYGSVLVETAGVEIGRADTVVDIATIADLARLAEGSGRMILRERSPRGDLYLVADEHTLYVHRVAGLDGVLAPLPLPRRDGEDGLAAHAGAADVVPSGRWRRRRR